jgi:copper chaperone CopZ
MKKTTTLSSAILLASLLFFSSPAHSLEFQWKYVVPTMDNREKAVQVFDLLNDIIGVYDVTINLDTNSLMLFYDDERTDEEAVKEVLLKAGFPVKRMMLLKEPREGVMN